MEALILAAGRGSRLRHGRRPKCLAEVDGRPLIEYQLDALRAAGIGRVTVVAGFEIGQVRRALRGAATVVENHRYALTNSVYSFLMARDQVRDDVLVVNSDVLFHPEVARRLVGRPGSAVAYDSRSGADPEEMKLEVRHGRLVEMSKTLAAERVCGENLGVLRLDRAAARRAFDTAEQLVADGRENDWLGSAINGTAGEHPIKCLDTKGLPWVEIDFPQDLKRARRTVLPAIRRTLPRSGHAPPNEFFSGCFERRRRPRYLTALPGHRPAIMEPALAATA